MAELMEEDSHTAATGDHSRTPLSELIRFLPYRGLETQPV